MTDPLTSPPTQPPTLPTAAARPSRIVLALMVLLMAAGAGLFAWRGPAFVARESPMWGNRDFCLIYASVRAWIEGKNPYEERDVRAAFLNAGTPQRDPMSDRVSAVLVYPPGAYGLIGALCLLPWALASTCWWILNTGCYIVAIRAVQSLARLRGSAALALWAWAFFLAPAHTAVAHGQTSMIVLACVALGALVRARAIDRTGGVRKGAAALHGLLLGAALALKPQLAILFFVYEVGRGRWRTAAWTLLALAAFSGIGIARLEMAHVDWIASWTRNLHDFTTIDDANPTATNPIRYQVINLQYPLHTFLESRTLVSALVLGVLGMLSLAYLAFDQGRGGAGPSGERRAGAHGEVLSLAMTSLVTLSIAYHRHYDAVVLLFPIAAVLALPRSCGWMWRGVLAVVLASFVAPWGVLMVWVEQKGWAPSVLLKSPLWADLIVPAQAWALPVAILAVAVLRRALARSLLSAPAGSSSPRTPSPS